MKFQKVIFKKSSAEFLEKYPNESILREMYEGVVLEEFLKKFVKKNLKETLGETSGGILRRIFGASFGVIC